MNYEHTQTIIQNGGKTVRKVTIKNGRGFKSITKYRKGKKTSTVKRPIHRKHIRLIKAGTFVPGLFSDCKDCKKSRV